MCLLARGLSTSYTVPFWTRVLRAWLRADLGLLVTKPAFKGWQQEGWTIESNRLELDGAQAIGRPELAPRTGEETLVFDEHVMNEVFRARYGPAWEGWEELAAAYSGPHFVRHPLLLAMALADYS
jgi:hypothetical protein